MLLKRHDRKAINVQKKFPRRKIKFVPGERTGTGIIMNSFHTSPQITGRHYGFRLVFTTLDISDTQANIRKFSPEFKVSDSTSGQWFPLRKILLADHSQSNIFSCCSEQE